MRKSVAITDALHWVGAIDYGLRSFDITMHTKYGTTYNSYVLKGTERTILFETVKEQFFDEFMERLSCCVRPDEIDAVVISHTEPDHSGALSKLLEICPDIEVVASPPAMALLDNIINKDFLRHTVRSHETMDIGGKTLEFILAPFLHWPDTMFTYIKEEAILVTCDGFGSHYASDKLFNDELEAVEYEDYLEAYWHYFDCLLSPFKPYVLSCLDKLEGMEIRAICNAHGPIIRRDIPHLISLYRDWATPAERPRKRIVIAYVSVYSYTRVLAQGIREGIKAAGGADVKLYDLQDREIREVLDDIKDADGLLVGSPTLVGDTPPPIWQLLSHLNSFAHRQLVVGAFGSYGWSGEAVPNIEARFEQLKLHRPLDGLRAVMRPSEQDMDKAHDFGRRFVEALRTHTH